jgi:hypothetical protein
MRIGLAAVAALCVAGAGARPICAGVITQAQSFDPNLYSADFSQFNPANGALQSVNLTLNAASLNPFINVTNTSGSAQSGNITVSVSGLLHASLPGNPLESVLIGTETVAVSLAPHGSTSLQQSLNATWDPATLQFNTPELLSDFTGTGDIRFNAFFGQGYLRATSDNPAFTTTQLGPVLSDSAVLDYGYEIGPEPASFILLGVAGLALMMPGMFWPTVVEGRSQADVAAEKGVSAAVVRMAKSRILHRLKEKFGELIQ